MYSSPTGAVRAAASRSPTARVPAISTSSGGKYLEAVFRDGTRRAQRHAVVGLASALTTNDASSIGSTTVKPSLFRK